MTDEELEAVKAWVRSAPPAVKEWMDSIHFRRFILDRRQETFQMQCRYDGSMSDACKKLFAREYRVLRAITEESYEPTTTKVKHDGP